MAEFYVVPSGKRIKFRVVYIEQAIRNAEFCDLIYVDDNESTDQTTNIVAKLVEELNHDFHTIDESDENPVQSFKTDARVFTTFFAPK